MVTRTRSDREEQRAVPALAADQVSAFGFVLFDCAAHNRIVCLPESCPCYVFVGWLLREDFTLAPRLALNSLIVYIGLEFIILSMQTPECWNYRTEPSHQPHKAVLRM